jgi:DNA mismatch endonuclease, patch repair protein
MHTRTTPPRTRRPVTDPALPKHPYDADPVKNDQTWLPVRSGSPESPSWATSQATRRSMQANRRRDTRPELAIRRLLHAHGMRYRVDVRPVPRIRHTADIVFIRARVAVFVDGCWWHGCTDHYRPPTSNSDYWANKVARNRSRDREVDEALLDAGWQVIRIWEHESAESAARRIELAVRGAG